MVGGVAVEDEDNGFSHQAWCVWVEKLILGVLIMGAALQFNVK